MAHLYYTPVIPSDQTLQQRAIQLCQQAHPLITQGYFEAALSLLNEAFYVYPHIEDLQYARGLCLYKLGKHEEARVAVKAEMDTYPGKHHCGALFISILCDPDRGLSQKEILCKREYKIFSQNGEDGILLYIFSKIGSTNRIFVEIGIGNGTECNTANLSLNFAWSGLLIEGNEQGASYAKNYYANKPVKVLQSFVTSENINHLLRENGIAGEIDLLSIDVDGIDYWLWKNLTVIQPRVVVIEYNASFGWNKSLTVRYEPHFDRFKYHSFYHGASLVALAKLANAKGYMLVGCNSHGVNAFFVHREVVSNRLVELSAEEAYYPQIYREEFKTTEEQFEQIKHFVFDVV